MVGSGQRRRPAYERGIRAIELANRKENNSNEEALANGIAKASDSYNLIGCEVDLNHRPLSYEANVSPNAAQQCETKHWESCPTLCTALTGFGCSFRTELGQ